MKDLKTKSPTEISHPPAVTTDTKRTNSQTPERPTATTATVYKAEQTVKGRSTAITLRAHASVVDKGARRQLPPNEMSNLGQIINTNVAEAPVQDLPALYEQADRMLQKLTPDIAHSSDYIERVLCIKDVCYVRMLDSALDQVANERLPAVVKELRKSAKWFLDEDEIGYELREMFNKLIDRIEERQASIGAIPEIAHVVWLGKPISPDSVKNLMKFLLLNENYEVLIGTDRVQETLRAIEQVSEHGSERLLARLKPCDFNKWLPADEEMIGDVSGAEIRALVDTLRSGPGRVYPGASDVLRLLALRSEKIVNDQRTRGGLYFDVDLEWHKPLPELSSPLGITLNLKPGGKLNNNVLGVPDDTEVIDRLIQDIVHGYRDRTVKTVSEDEAAHTDSDEEMAHTDSEEEMASTVLKDVKMFYPNVAAKIWEMENRERAESTLLEHTGNDPMYEFKSDINESDKRRIRQENRTRAKEILAQFHPDKIDYSRFRYAIDDMDNSSRLALTTVLTGPGRLYSSLIDMFGYNLEEHKKFTQLGTIGRKHTDPEDEDEDAVYTENVDAKWDSDKALGRRASIGGPTITGELEDPPTHLPLNPAEVRNSKSNG